MFRGEMSAGIPATCWKLREGEDPGFSLYDLASLLLDDTKEAIAHFDARPVSNSMTEEGASGFHH